MTKKELLSLKKSYIRIFEIIKNYGEKLYDKQLNILEEQIKCIEYDIDTEEKTRCLIDNHRQLFFVRTGFPRIIKYINNDDEIRALKQEVFEETCSAYDILKKYMIWNLSESKNKQLEAVINDIKANVDKKNIQYYAKRLTKKDFSAKRQTDSDNLKNLVSWLFIYDYNDYVLEIYDAVKALDFAGDYSIWDCYTVIHCFASRILKEKSEFEKSQKIIDFLNRYTDPTLYNNGVEWFTETLDKNIKSNEEQGSKSRANDWRNLKIISAVQYKELTGYPYSDEYLENAIIENKNILSKLK